MSSEMLEKLGKTQEDTEFYTPMPAGYRKGHHKYVVVVGTVMSGLGKGIFSSSLAKLLQDKGLRVAPIKMEGYINIDSGTLNPYRHGEVFVLDDGMETDMDLGTYERLLDQDLSAANFTTNGQILSGVLKKERDGDYLGRDVQVIPHVVGEVKLKLRELAARSQADVIFVNNRRLKVETHPIFLKDNAHCGAGSCACLHNGHRVFATCKKTRWLAIHCN